MAMNGKITIEEGGKLIVEGGEITCWCKNGNWKGIKTKKDKLKMKNGLQLINGGRVTRIRAE